MAQRFTRDNCTVLTLSAVPFKRRRASYEGGNDCKPPLVARSSELRFSIQTDQEDDGRWIAEIPEVPGAMAYGTTVGEAKAKAYAIALSDVSASSL